jgi:hypothetical protein
MFCLDPIKRRELASNPIGCPCLYKSHGSCLQTWFEQKNQYECPICHKISVPEPIPPLQIVHVERRRSFDGHQKCLGGCCLGLILWAVIINVVNYILSK